MMNDSFLPSVSTIDLDNPFACGLAVGAAAANKEMLFSSLLKPAAPAPVNKKYYNVKQAATYLSVSESTIYELALKKKVKKLGGSYRFSIEQLDSFFLPRDDNRVSVKRNTNTDSGARLLRTIIFEKKGAV